jgi:hypothetical protein
VLHFRPTRWDRWVQRLELITGELLPDQAVPLLKRRQELSREESGCRVLHLGRRIRSLCLRLA